MKSKFLRLHLRHHIFSLRRAFFPPSLLSAICSGYPSSRPAREFRGHRQSGIHVNSTALTPCIPQASPPVKPLISNRFKAIQRFSKVFKGKKFAGSHHINSFSGLSDLVGASRTKNKQSIRNDYLACGPTCSIAKCPR